MSRKEGPQGKEGLQGKEGPEGSNAVWLAGNGSSAESKPPLEISPPPGTYLVQAKTTAYGTANEVFTCTLRGGSESDSTYGELSSTISQQTVPNLEVTTLSAGEKIRLECTGKQTFYYADMTATKTTVN